MQSSPSHFKRSENLKTWVKIPEKPPISPNSIQIEDETKARITTSCNKEIDKVDDIPPRERKRAEYGIYSLDTRHKMDPAETVHHFIKTLWRNIIMVQFEVSVNSASIVQETQKT